MNSLFDIQESFNLKTIVEDSRAFAKKFNPILPDEDIDSYNDRLFWAINDEIARRILISGKKRPNYKTKTC